jgi:S-layer homology domain/IPT/TIG domain
VVGAAPGDLYQGATMDVLLLGGNTNFGGSSAVSFSGSGITVNSKEAISPTSLLVNVTLDAAAATGFRDVTVSTPLGGGVIEETAGTGQVRVVTNPGTAQLVSVQPFEAARGTTVDITIFGINTHFGADSSVSVFGVPINSMNVVSPTKVEANITIPADAALGFHLVRVISMGGAEFAQNAGLFRIVSLIGPKASAPTISALDPTSKGKGATFDLEVTGLATNFADGLSFGSLNSTGIDVLSTNVTSPTSAILRVRLGADTELGFHDVLVTTGGEVASIPDGFQVTANPTTMDPTSGPSAGGTPFVVTSSDFQAGAGVTVGGAAATSVSVPDATHVNATAPARPPGTLHDVVVGNPDGTGWSLFKGWLSDFLDVPQAHGFHDFIERLFRAAITSGCTGGNYCPASSVTRAQMAVFLLRGKHGGDYQPPPATGTAFSDVPAGAFAAAWIEQLAEEGITSGCGGGNYCPNNPVTREQMALFLLRAKFGSDHVPPDPTGVFGDVPVSSPFAKWIEELASLGITSGCGGGNFCPASPNTRGQMAVFLVKTFNLP